MAFNTKKIPITILRYLAIFILCLASILLASFILLQIPKVQNFLAQKVTVFLSNKINSGVSVKQIRMGFLKDLIIEGFYLEDQKGDTLLYAEEIEINISYLGLLNKEIFITEIHLDHPYLHAYKPLNSDHFNYTFIGEAFKDTSSNESTWNFRIDEAQLNNGNIKYADYPAGFEIMSQTELLKITIQDFETTNFILNNTEINNTQTTINLFPTKKNSPSKEEKKESSFTFEDIQITNSKIVYNNFAKTAEETGMDYNRLEAININGIIEKIEINDFFAISIQELALEEKSGFQLKDLKGNLTSDNSHINIEIEKLQTPESNLQHKLVLAFPNTDITKNAMGEIAVDGKLNKEILSINDLAYFLPKIDTIEFIKNKKIELTANISGKVKDFSIKGLSLIIDSNNTIAGNFMVTGLPEIETAQFELTDLKINTNSESVQYFIYGKNLPVTISNLGTIAVNGKAKGSLNNFSANLSALTSLGQAKGDFQMQINDEFKPQSFEGNFTLSGFNAGRFLKDDQGIGKISLSTFISSPKKDNYHFNTSISLLEFNNYPYQNILLNGKIETDSLITDIVMNDPNLEGELAITTSLKNRLESYKVKGVISLANLQALQLTEKPITIKTFINADLQGAKIDSITGDLLLIAFELIDPNYSYEADSIIFNSDITNGIHTVSFNAPEIKADLSGQYRLKDLPDAALHFINHYYSGVKKPAITYHPKSLDFHIKTGNPGPLLHMFVPEVEEFRNLQLSGSFREENHTLHATGSIEKVIFKNNAAENLNLTIEADEEKFYFQSNVNYLTFTNKTKLQNPQLEGTIANDQIVFNFKLFEQKAASKINIDGALALKRDTIQLRFTSAEIFVEGKEWNVNPNNLITYSENYLMIENLELQQEEQSIIINSHTLFSGNTNLDANLIKLNLHGITELIGNSEYNVTGIVNGHLSLTDVFKGKGVEAELQIDSLAMNNHGIGNITADIHKISGDEQININVSLSGGGSEATAIGNYQMGAEGRINVNVKIDNLPLQPFEPFVKNSLFKLEGNMAGYFKVHGTTASPQLDGTLSLKENTLIGLNVTNTVYKLSNQEINFTENAILFNDITLNDQMNNNIVIDGSIYHKGFQNFRVNLSLHTDRFMVVNSEYSPDAEFYGDVFVKANATINGALEDLIIDINTITLDGSSIFIPLNTQAESQGLPGYIRFEELDTLNSISKNLAGRNDSSLVAPTDDRQKIDMSKFNISWNLEVTPETNIHIIVDENNGDMITGTGHGEFMLDFDSENHINIFGTFEIENGDYEFSFLSLIKKKFSIEQGSTVTWAGDIEDGTLDITALYKTNASRYGLVSDQAEFLSAGELNAARANLPVEVYLYLSGELTRPELTFDIVIPEGAGELSNNLTVQRINEIKNDPTELNRQVFSLIVFNRFLETGTETNISAGNIALRQVNQSVSQILNSQLSKLSDDVLNGLDVNVSLESLEQQYGTFGQRAMITTSKQISERVTVSVGGSVNLYGANGSGQFAGDYYVHYRLNESGSVNLKFFRTSQQNIYTNILNTRSGASINYRKEFNWWWNKNKDEENKEENN